MHNKDRKYIYYEDRFGCVIGYIDDMNPNCEDKMQVTIIAERAFSSVWNIGQRGITIMVDLRKVNKWKFYESYEEFGEAFFEAIL